MRANWEVESQLRRRDPGRGHCQGKGLEVGPLGKLRVREVEGRVPAASPGNDKGEAHQWSRPLNFKLRTLEFSVPKTAGQSQHPPCQSGARALGPS